MLGWSWEVHQLTTQPVTTGTDHQQTGLLAPILESENNIIKITKSALWP